MAEKVQVTPASAESAAAAFKPYVSPDQAPPEFTVKAVILGAIFGLVFGAVTVYLALRAGLTVSASVPIAVLAIAIFKRLGRATILENNIVQTAGSAGESIAAGVVFTLPALILLGFAEYFTPFRIFLVALVGGCLGVMFMIPLRRYLIVKEHGNLTYPEGTACADVLVAGERGGSFAGMVFWGLGIGAVYKFLMEGLRLWKDTPTYQPRWHPGGMLAGNITPEYLGVGYIIGPRIAGTIFAGGVLSLAGADSRNRVFRRRGGDADLSRHHSHRRHGPWADLAQLHPAHRRRRRGHGRVVHSVAHHPHHCGVVPCRRARPAGGPRREG